MGSLLLSGLTGHGNKSSHTKVRVSPVPICGVSILGVEMHLRFPTIATMPALLCMAPVVGTVFSAPVLGTGDSGFTMSSPAATDACTP